MADTKVVYAMKIISVNGNNKWYRNGTLVVHMWFMKFVVKRGAVMGSMVLEMAVKRISRIHIIDINIQFLHNAI